jgi:hypothetical protein
MRLMASSRKRLSLNKMTWHELLLLCQPVGNTARVPAYSVHYHSNGIISSHTYIQTNDFMFSILLFNKTQ